MNRRNFMHLIGAAVAAPVVGVSLPVVSGIPILHAHDANALAIGKWLYVTCTKSISNCTLEWAITYTNET